MGCHEDDRIRNKNQHISRALDMYESYKANMWSDNDIVTHVTNQLEVSTQDKVLYELLKIAVRKTKEFDRAAHNED